MAHVFFLSVFPKLCLFPRVDRGLENWGSYEGQDSTSKNGSVITQPMRQYSRRFMATDLRLQCFVGLMCITLHVSDALLSAGP